MSEYWPQAGERMSDYIANRKKATAVQTLERAVQDHPELTLSLIDQLKEQKLQEKNDSKNPYESNFIDAVNSYPPRASTTALVGTRQNHSSQSSYFQKRAQSQAQGVRRATSQQANYNAISERGRQYYFDNIHDRNKVAFSRAKEKRQSEYVLLDYNQKSFQQRFQQYFDDLNKTTKDTKGELNPTSSQRMNTASEHTRAHTKSLGSVAQKIQGDKRTQSSFRMGMSNASDAHHQMTNISLMQGRNDTFPTGGAGPQTSQFRGSQGKRQPTGQVPTGDLLSKNITSVQNNNQSVFPHSIQSVTGAHQQTVTQQPELQTLPSQVIATSIPTKSTKPSKKSQSNKETDDKWKEYKDLVKTIIDGIDEEFYKFVCGRDGVKPTLIQKDFRAFLAHRYGPVVAFKWQNLLDFPQNKTLDEYRLNLQQIFMNKNVLYQLGFDFYDTNNDERISELDLFKIMQTFSADHSLADGLKLPENQLNQQPVPSFISEEQKQKATTKKGERVKIEGCERLFTRSIFSDLMPMTHICEWLFQKKVLDKKFSKRENCQKLHDFRSLLSQDENFVINKQKMMMPVMDPFTGEHVKIGQKSGNWLTQLIGRESTYEGLEQVSQAKAAGRSGTDVKLEQEFEEEDSEQEQNFFHGSAYHQMVKAQREAMRKQKNMTLIPTTAGQPQGQTQNAEATEPPAGIVPPPQTNKEKDKNPPAIYLMNRPACKLAVLNERQKTKSSLVVATTTPITGTNQIDQYLTSYFETTKDPQNVYIDLVLFKKIAFQSGMPLIVVDLMQFLVGGFYQKLPNSGKLNKDVAHAMRLLDDRVKPVQKTVEPKLLNKASTILGKKAPPTTTLPTDLIEQEFIPKLNQKLMKLINRKINKIIPPLKDMPEIIEPVLSEDSEDPAQEAAKAEFKEQCMTLQSYLQILIKDNELPPQAQAKQDDKAGKNSKNNDKEPQTISRAGLAWEKCESFFRKLSRVNPAKLAKLKQANDKLPLNEQELPPLKQLELNEQTLKDGFQSAFGVKCDIFATLLYVKASKQTDYATLNFCDLTQLLIPLLNDNRQLRNRAVFNILDSNGSGEIQLVQLLNIYKKLPNKTLFKHEIALLIEEYKQKNILMKAGNKNAQPVTFSIFNKIIPNSAVAKYLCFKAFGFSMPIVQNFNPDDDCLGPPNPFEPIEDDYAWRLRVKELYPRDEYDEDFDQTNFQKMQRNMLNDQQIAEIYNHGFAEQATYVTRKLK